MQTGLWADRLTWAHVAYLAHQHAGLDGSAQGDAGLRVDGLAGCRARQRRHQPPHCRHARCAPRHHHLGGAARVGFKADKEGAMQHLDMPLRTPPEMKHGVDLMEADREGANAELDRYLSNPQEKEHGVDIVSTEAQSLAFASAGCRHWQAQ